MDLLPYQELMTALRKKRRRLEVTQRELANRAGISKSLLSQMEHGKKEAKYADVYAVWEHLQLMERKQGETAGELMNAPIQWVSPDDSVLDVRKLMREHNFSQIPVEKDGELVGNVTEADLIDVDDAEAPIGEIMGESFETVSAGAGRDVITALLKEDNGALIVEDGGEYEGIITKADLI